MEPFLSLCTVARAMNVLLGEGATLDVLQTRRHVLDGDLFTWIDGRFPRNGFALSYIPTGLQAEVYELFQELALVRTEGKYCVSNNGLCVILAYCIESIQQLASASR